jgi:hypothetical protein
MARIAEWQAEQVSEADTCFSWLFSDLKECTAWHSMHFTSLR